VSCNKIIEPTTDFSNDYSETVILTKADEPDFHVSFSDVEWLIQNLYPEDGAFEIEAYPDEDTPLMYAVNYDEGWKIVSGDKRTDPILAFSEEGKMCISDNSNPGFNMWLEDVSKFIESLEGIKEDYKRNLKLWKYVFSVTDVIETKSGSGRWYRELMGEYLQGSYVNVVNPLLSTKWGQGYPWNLHAPLDPYSNSCLLGCGPIALSQIIYYNHFNSGIPQGLYHSISISKYNTINLGYYWTFNYYINRDDLTSPSPRWADMPINNTAALANLTFTGYVSDFILDVAGRLEVQFTSDGTSTDSLKVVPALSYFGMTGILSDFNYSSIYSDLSDSKPVFIGGENTSTGEGHAWVIDGQRQDLITTRRIYIWHEADSSWQGETYSTAEAQAMLGDEVILAEGVGYLETTEELGPKYLHMNWGLNGNDDGYYSLVNWYYNSNMKIVYNIHASSN
jgi:hypothetical protein